MNHEKIAKLIIKAQKGDLNARNQIVSESYEDIYYYVLKTVKSEDIAADVTQETFLEIIETLDKLREPNAFNLWARRIAFHQYTRYFRKNKEVLVEENEDGETIFDEIPDESEGALPEQVAEDKEFRATIMNMINSLSPEQTNALLLFYYEKMSIKQIAEIQDTTENTVKSRLNYARKAIKGKVEEYEAKTGTKLHSVAILPLLLRFVFGADKSAMPKLAIPASLTAGVGVTAGAGATAAGVGTTAGATAVAAKAGIGAVVTKIIAGVVAASLAIGGTVFGISKLSDKNNKKDNDDDDYEESYEENGSSFDDNNLNDSTNEGFGEESNAVSEEENWEGNTDVNFRIVLKSTMSTSSCTVTLFRYDSMTAEEPNNDESFSSLITVYRNQNWQSTISLEPGFYEVIGVSPAGLNSLNIFGSTERFEVKGKEMTVYVATDRPEEPVDMPENWLVYGEDNQNFYIWSTIKAEDIVKINGLKFIKYTKDDGTFAYKLTDGDDYSNSELTIPKSISGIPVDKISQDAFFSNEVLKNVVIPEHITEIGQAAFAGSSIEKLTLTNAIPNRRSFFNSPNLKEVIFADGATVISNYMFWKCYKLEYVTISASVEKINTHAFAECTSLTEITYLGTMEQWANIEIDKTWCSQTNLTTIHCTDGDIKIN